MAATTPTWDGAAFASWLRRWKDAERLEWGDIAERSGLHISTVMQLARGVPQKERRDRGQKDVNPAINTLTRLATGLGVELGYVLAKGGMFVGDPARWDHFAKPERALIADALKNTDVVGLSDYAARDHLVHELEATLTEEVPA